MALTIEGIVSSLRLAAVRRDESLVKELLGLYRAAYASVKADSDLLIAKMLNARESGLPVRQDWVWQRAGLGKLLRDIENAFQDYGEKVGRLTVRRQSEYLTQGLDAADRLLGTLNVGFRGLPPNVGESLVGFLQDGSPLMDLFKGFGDLAADDAKQALFTAVVKGESGREAGRGLRAALNVSRDRATTIGRTETNRVRRTATEQTYEANSDVLSGQRWTCAFTTATCAACIAMDGQVFPVGTAMASHPNCRCAWVPITPLSRPPTRTGEDYLRSLGEDDQDAILGRIGGELFRADKLDLQDFVQKTRHERWGAGRTTRSLEKMRERGLVTAQDIADARAASLERRGRFGSQRRG